MSRWSEEILFLKVAFPVALAIIALVVLLLYLSGHLK